MGPRDIVLFPAKADGRIHIGRVTGDYRYDPAPEPDFPHHRPVTWLKAVPRTIFSKEARYEIGGLLTLFQVKRHAAEFLAALEGKPIPQPLIAGEGGPEPPVIPPPDPYIYTALA